MTAVVGQLDLFAEAGPQLTEREAWAARFERAPWVAPYDTAGLRKGESVLGWICPACGRLEVNDFVLNINHGYDPSIPGRAPFGPFGEGCSRQSLLASQQRARELQAGRDGAP